MKLLKDCIENIIISNQSQRVEIENFLKFSWWVYTQSKVNEVRILRWILLDYFFNLKKKLRNWHHQVPIHINFLYSGNQEFSCSCYRWNTLTGKWVKKFSFMRSIAHGFRIVAHELPISILWQNNANKINNWIRICIRNS